MDFATAYGPKNAKKQFFDEPSRAKQSFRDECDINNIIAHVRNRGTVTHLNDKQPLYGYAPSVDLRESLELSMNAIDSFEELPARIRKEFDNDPVRFVEFIENPENIDQLREWDLLAPEKHISQDDLESTEEPETAPEPPAEPG